MAQAAKYETEIGIYRTTFHKVNRFELWDCCANMALEVGC